MQAIDQNVLQFFTEYRTEWLSFLMLAITYSGGYLVAISVTILSALSFFIHHHPKRILPLLISVLGSTTTIFLLKNIFDKKRPISEALYFENSSSFPSGHATIAIALYGFILYFIWKYDQHPLKNPFIIFLFILIILIGLSRLYLGVHYLSDVLTGYTIGFVWLFISIHLTKKI